MFRKGGVEKRLKKISIQEAASMKLLEKQEIELVKAVEENERLVETVLVKQSPAEAKIRSEIDKLTRKLKQLNCDLEKVKKMPYSNFDVNFLIISFTLQLSGTSLISRGRYINSHGTLR